MVRNMKREFSCTVLGVEKHILPRIIKVSCELEGGGKLLFEYHEELELNYSSGEKLLLTISEEKIQPRSPDDYCGKAFLYKIIDSANEKVYLFSMGGYIFRLNVNYSINDLKIAEHYFICVSKS